LSRLFLVRHGDTELNSAERYWGRSDVKLSDAGIWQAEKLRERLVVEKFDAVYSSDLERAVVTAEIIASNHQLVVIACTELREVNFGRLEGLTFSEICQLYPEVARSWAERNPQFKYPGGESFIGFNKRVSKFLNKLEGHDIEETILIVAHAGVLRTLVCQLLDIDMQRRWQIRIDLASLSMLETNQRGAVLCLLNDVSHLT